MAAANSYRYCPLPSPHHIRVLTIDQGTTAEVSATIQVVDLDDSPIYDCLSYVWNGPHSKDVGNAWNTACKTMLLDGTAMPIRQNLYDALTSFRIRGYAGPIWIDAVCINQADIPERNAQVALMSRLYTDARDVLVWLGYEDAHAAVALQAMSRLSFSMERVVVRTESPDGKLDFDPDLEPITEDFERCKFDDAELCAIARFFAENVWFSRIWTLQEMILARKMHFQCGGLSASLEVVWRGSAIACLFAGLCSAWFELKGQREQERSYRFFHDIIKKHVQQITGDQGSYIGIAANEHRRRDATDPRDKVFGLLGISVTSTKSLREPLKADYTKPVQEVFTRAALFAILAWQGWEALSLVGDRTTNKIPNLPSWVPDYTCELPWTPLQRSPCSFRTASSGLEAEFGLIEDAMHVIKPLYHQFDVVTSITYGTWTAGPDDGQQGMVDVCNFVLDPSPILTEGDDDVLFVLARTVTADQTGARSHIYEYDLKSAFEKMAYCQIWRTIKSKDPTLAEQLMRDITMSLLPALRELGISNADSIAGSLERGRLMCKSELDIHMTSQGREQSANNAVIPYLDDVNSGLQVDWQKAAKNKSLFRTQKGHLGLGPRTVQVGDRVGILQGAQVPHLFRHMPKDAEDVLDLVGEAYVYGIMYGELQDEGRLAFSTITLY